MRRKAVPIAMATGPAEYTAGQQELPVRLTSLADMVQWAQNWSRSRSIWPLGYGLGSSAIEMIAAASAPQYDLSRFGSEVFRSSPRKADLMIVAGTVLIKMGPRLRLLWEPSGRSWTRTGKASPSTPCSRRSRMTPAT
jgi:NADH-quinone oxidoreductase subunit B